MSYLDGIDAVVSRDSEEAFQAIYTAEPLTTAKGRRLIAVSLMALEKADAEDPEFVEIAVKRLDLIRQLRNMDERLAKTQEGPLPTGAAKILRDVACDAFDEFDAAASAVPSLAVIRNDVIDDVIKAVAPSPEDRALALAPPPAPAQPSEVKPAVLGASPMSLTLSLSPEWGQRLRTLALYAVAGLAVYGAYSAITKRGR